MARRRRRSPIESPTLAEVYNELRQDFRAAKDTRFVSRLSGVSSAGSGMDYHYRDERQFLHMMERARFYQRNDPIVGQGVRRLVANVVQDGFRLDPATGDKELDEDLKARWREWSESPDACHSEGELTWNQMEQLTLSHVLVDGDICALPRREGFLQFVEAHRLRTPRNTTRNVIHGILLDDDARRLQYWFTREDLDPRRSLERVSDVKAYDARDGQGNRQVFHCYNPYRFSQRRGVTTLAPVSDTVGMHDDIQFAKLVQVQTASLIALLHERGPGWEPIGDQQKGDRETETTAGGSTRLIEGISAGIEVFGDKDERLTAFSPNLPNPEFFPHATLILTFIAINLDMPVAVLLLDPSQTNFSGWRGAIDQARLRFRQIQQWLRQKLHQPVYLWKLRQWMATDAALRSAAAREGINLVAHSWNLPTFPYIEPLKDASADLLQLRNALNSPRRIHAAKGRDWNEVAAEIVEDNGTAIETAIKRADELNRRFPSAKVHWRELISLPTPDGVQVSLNSAGDEPPPPSNGNGTNRIKHLVN